MNPFEISIVIPVYCCSGNINELYNRLVTSLNSIVKNRYEIIFVNDASPENDWEIIRQISVQDPSVKGISLSRNFGQHHAITAGLDYATGNWIVVMDGDLQDQPEEIVKLYQMALTGYDIVYARRDIRYDHFIKRISSALFYKILSYLTETRQDSSIANFGIYNSQVIDAVGQIRENLRYFPVMVRWVGFKSTSVPVNHSKRYSGKTAYTYRKLFHMALNVMLATSDKPLRLFVKFGFCISLISLLYACNIMIKALLGKTAIMGWPSLIVSIWMLSGLIITLIGVVGLYVGKTFDEAKHKPLYIVKERLND